MVRKLTNLLAYLDERLGGHSGRGPEYHFYCPACVDRTGDESSKRKLGVNVAIGMGGCFRCGWGFRSFSGLFRYLNGGHIRMEEIALLRNEVQLPKSDLLTAVRTRMIRRKHLAPRPVALPPEFELLCELPADVRSSMRYLLPFAYLRDRGVSEEKLQTYQIGYCATGEYGQRLIFPVIQNDLIVYWTNRFCGPHDMKSKNPPNVEGYHQRGTCLLNYDNCLCFPRVALVEGPFSAMAFESAALARARRDFAGVVAGSVPHSAGVDVLTPALAMMGKFLTDEQRKLISAMVAKGLEEIVVALDPGAGQQADEARSALLGVVPKVSMLVLTDGDPDDERGRLPALLQGRRVPSVTDRVRQRLNG